MNNNSIIKETMIRNGKDPFSIRRFSFSFNLRFNVSCHVILALFLNSVIILSHVSLMVPISLTQSYVVQGAPRWLAIYICMPHPTTSLQNETRRQM